jgi:hypothetical protein
MLWPQTNTIISEPHVASLKALTCDAPTKQNNNKKAGGLQHKHKVTSE